MPTTNPLPLSALGLADREPAAAPDPASSSYDEAHAESAVDGTASLPDIAFRSRVSYYTPNPLTLTDDPSSSTTTSRAIRPRVPRGRGRG